MKKGRIDSMSYLFKLITIALICLVVGFAIESFACESYCGSYNDGASHSTYLKKKKKSSTGGRINHTKRSMANIAIA